MATTRFINACIKHACRRRNIFTQSSCKAPSQVQMPALSPTMEEGTITKWLVAEGDSVEVGDAMCEVETDKAVVTMEANEDGIVAKILVPEGTKSIKISVPIAILAEEGEDWKEVAKTEIIQAAAAPAQSEVNETAISIPEIKPPVKSSSARLSPAVRQTLLHHHIDAKNITGTGPKGLILKGDVLQHILANNLKPQNYIPETTQLAPKTAQSSSTATTVKQKTTQTSDSYYEDIELSNVRKVIAKRLSESKRSIPHSYSSTDCKIDKILNLRKQLSKEEVKLSVNDFIIKAAAQTLTQVPEVNSLWNGEQAEQATAVDVSVAVATDGGLITPIVKDASRKGIAMIGAEIRELASRARAGKLKPDEYQGGTFTISNLGMFGIREFTAVINPPQASILAVGGTRSRPVPRSHDDDDSDGSSIDYDVESVMTVTMSSDARVVDDELAARFLAKFKHNMENPMMLGLL